MKVLVIDDDPIVGRSLVTILGAQPDIEVVGAGVDGDQAVTLFAATHPDVLLMDIQMQGRDGLSAAEEILAGNPTHESSSSRPSRTTSTSSEP